jgi:quinohemoprotein ethanol dehydrogenase
MVLADLAIGGESHKVLMHAPKNGFFYVIDRDPVEQRKRWEVPYNDSLFNGGTMTTAGNLVFQGTGWGQFIAYSASTGEKLWSFYAGLGIIAAPISYSVDGQQYVSLLVGYGGNGGILGKLADYGWRFDEQPRRLLTFALDRHVPLPPGKPPRFNVKAVDSPSLAIDQGQAARGAKEYQSALCGFCHGAQLENVGSFAPDLRESALAAAWPAFRSVLHEGALANLGMPKFGHLTEDKMRAIYLYIRQGARDAIHSSNEGTKPSSHGS